MHRPPRRRFAVRAALALTALAALIAGCALPGPGRPLRIGEDELRQRLVREFPLERRVLEVVDVAMTAPELRLLPARNRVAAVVDLALRERLTDRTASGKLAFDAALRWAGDGRSLRLADVRVDRFAIDAGGGRLPVPAERLAAALAERALDGLVVYRVPQRTADALAGAGVAPGEVAVVDGAVELRFTALPR